MIGCENNEIIITNETNDSSESSVILVNIQGKVKFPGMNDPTRTFEFLNRISALPSRNAIIPFSNASEVRDSIKRQAFERQ